MCRFCIFGKNSPCLDAEEEEDSPPQEPAPATTESNLDSQPALATTETNLPPKAAPVTTEKNKKVDKACELSDEEYSQTSDSESLPSLLLKCRAFWEEKGETNNLLTEAAPVTTEKNKKVVKACKSEKECSVKCRGSKSNVVRSHDLKSLPSLLVKCRVSWEKGECSKSKENNNETETVAVSSENNTEEVDVENNNGGNSGDEEERDLSGSKR
ncbi:hypothetical protein SLA2020_429290 [Shorea laevis]